MRHAISEIIKKEEKGMFGFLLMVAGTLGIPQAVAAAIVRYIDTADDVMTLVTFLAVLTGGVVATILRFGVKLFVRKVKNIIKRAGYAAAVAW